MEKIKRMEEMAAEHSSNMEKISILADKTCALQQKVDKLNNVAKMFSFMPEVAEYLKEYNVK